jgi:hypothetical protein
MVHKRRCRFVRLGPPYILSSLNRTEQCHKVALDINREITPKNLLASPWPYYHPTPSGNAGYESLFESDCRICEASTCGSDSSK